MLVQLGYGFWHGANRISLGQCSARRVSSPSRPRPPARRRRQRRRPPAALRSSPRSRWPAPGAERAGLDRIPRGHRAEARGSRARPHPGPSAPPRDSPRSRSPRAWKGGHRGLAGWSRARSATRHVVPGWRGRPPATDRAPLIRPASGRAEWTPARRRRRRTRRPRCGVARARAPCSRKCPALASATPEGA